VIHILMSQRCCVSLSSHPPATSQDHFLFRAQVVPSVGHKGVMLKTQYSFKPDIARGGSFACGVVAPFSSFGRDSQTSGGFAMCFVQ
jgi:hypothetical protein